ncbi:MAG: peptidoglycan-binding protein [Archangiaceae bacterium]|nr:peptidoglycan-binding protein [Archangiaceae bacterium]
MPTVPSLSRPNSNVRRLGGSEAPLPPGVDPDEVVTLDAFEAAKVAPVSLSYAASSVPVDSQDVGSPTNPSKTNAPGHRSKDAYASVIDQFHVGSNPRYAIRDTSGDGYDDTFCNIFAWDVMSAMGVQLPHWVYADGSPAPAYSYGSGGHEQDANSVNAWLNDQGPQYGWKEITPEQAQQYANQGYPVVASQYVNPIGHIAVVRPGTLTSQGPEIAQAGATNTNDSHAYNFFTPGKVQFFVNTSGGPPSTGPKLPVDSATAQVPHSDLTQGSKGGDVLKLQRALVKLGYLEGADLNPSNPLFGPKTLAAVKRFQTDHGITPAYGNFGPLTRAALLKAIVAREPRATAPAAPLVRGAEGAKVKQLKVALYRLGFLSKAALDAHPDEFGSGTEAALKKFQKAYGLQQSGKYGSGSEAKLKAALTALSESLRAGGSGSGSGAPSAAKIDTLLKGTPMAGQGANLAAFAKQYDVPAELALAMIWHEDQFMTTGIAPLNNNPGNLRFVGQPGAVSGVSGFAKWPTVKQGLEAYFKLLSTTYRRFIDQRDWAGLVHLYAPSSDGNDERAYVDAITSGMSRYRSKIS